MPKQAPQQSRQTNDRFAEQSFTFRQMKSWQLWSISVAAVLVILALLVWAA